MVIDYLKKLTFLTKEEIEEIEVEHNKAPEKRIAHKKLAEEVITFLHGHDEYLHALKISESLFSDKVTELSSKDIIDSLKGVPTMKIELNKNILDFVVENNICSSKREAREFVASGAIALSGNKVTDENYIVSKKDAIDEKIIIVKKGKKNYYLGLLS